MNGALTDRMLEVVDTSGNVVASNNDWRSDQEQDLIATTIPPNDLREAAIVVTVAPGAYTAVVRGKDQTAGIGLVEIHNLEQD